jgi:survival of motor neuron protein-interacting protein 1
MKFARYEAVRCPKVVVAQIDPSKLISEQTPYMPEIPDIPTCPSDLLPSKEWEKHFIDEFSYLRMVWPFSTC